MTTHLCKCPHIAGKSTGKFSFKGKEEALKNMGLTDEEIKKLTSMKPIKSSQKQNYSINNQKSSSSETQNLIAK
eukprot:gene445-6858_t